MIGSETNIKNEKASVSASGKAEMTKMLLQANHPRNLRYTKDRKCIARLVHSLTITAVT